MAAPAGSFLSPPSLAAYSQNQISIIRDIKNNKSHHEIFELATSCCTHKDARKFHFLLSLSSSFSQVLGPLTRTLDVNNDARYSQEEIAIIREIKKRSHYDILGLERTCTVEEVKKRYRKLCLKVHPDKNRAPGAEEAFNAVSEAFRCLSNEECRKEYDAEEEIFRNTCGETDDEVSFRRFSFGRGMMHRRDKHGDEPFSSGIIVVVPMLLYAAIVVYDFRQFILPLCIACLWERKL